MLVADSERRRIGEIKVPILWRVEKMKDSKFIVGQKVYVTAGPHRGRKGKIMAGWISYIPTEWEYYVKFGFFFEEIEKFKESELMAAQELRK